jgi:hypothetical protein
MTKRIEAETPKNNDELSYETVRFSCKKKNILKWLFLQNESRTKTGAGFLTRPYVVLTGL